MNFFSFSDNEWAKIQEPKKVLEKIGSMIDTQPLDNEVSVYKRNLPFYDNIQLIRLTSIHWASKLNICYLFDDNDNLYRLNGTSFPIHEVNEKAPINITEDNVLHYLTFFCSFVHGEDGPFYVLHDMEDEILPSGFEGMHSEDDEDSLRPQQLFREPRLFGKNEEGHWRVSSLIYYSSALFHADFLIQPNGMIEMEGEEPLIADLPNKIRLPLIFETDIAVD